MTYAEAKRAYWVALVEKHKGARNAVTAMAKEAGIQRCSVYAILSRYGLESPGGNKNGNRGNQFWQALG